VKTELIRKVQWMAWLLRRTGPYIALEILLPGGTAFALMSALAALSYVSVGWFPANAGRTAAETTFTDAFVGSFSQSGMSIARHVLIDFPAGDAIGLDHILFWSKQ